MQEINTYANYVFSAYFLTFITLSCLFIFVLKKYCSIKKRIKNVNKL
jgi:heme exporter protein CcmD